MKALFCEPELIDLIAQGDRKAFAQFYAAHLGNVYKYVFSITYSKETSEEIVQELFLKVWENRESLPRIKFIKTYLYQSAKNLLLDYIRRLKVESRVMDVIELHTPAGENYTENHLVYNEYYQIARQAINLLPEKRRKIFELRLNDGLSLDEIAMKLKISKSVVKKQLYAGVNFVRKYLSKHSEIAVLALYLIIYS
ncbi:RNA polymerase sigma-70 factor [Mucilaginibacter sp. SMC90]|uniref:RNA polymerase sigma factor n=1 Tax=Mucilaginibacter sp. SMC90 TaxID=2929803 RepID=UPI001FB29BBB|nr:RNA polymerase sigma-70 factor [Mucilaginibacter sp. SMC90]UOE47501.1 RNA polymerase sigma-70 factor [Mucilaginibacter sp. SMC90]